MLIVAWKGYTEENRLRLRSNNEKEEGFCSCVNQGATIELSFKEALHFAKLPLSFFSVKYKLSVKQLTLLLCANYISTITHCILVLSQ